MREDNGVALIAQPVDFVAEVEATHNFRLIRHRYSNEPI
jgi:hypothetical protein